MINSHAISSSGAHTHFNLDLNLPSKLSKTTSFRSLPSHISFNFNNTHVGKPKFSTRISPILRPRAAAASASAVCTAATEEETLYDLLGISKDVTLSEIKRAYKQMALKYHPDVSPPDQAEEYATRFIRVQEAYETLSDPEARAMYDSGMAKGLHLAFSGKKGARFDPRSEERSRWKDRWQIQVSELKRRSTLNTSRVDPNGRMSWGARIRMQRKEATANESVQDQ